MTPIPDTLTFAEAAIAEPLACAVNGLELAKFGIGKSICIIGLGPIGCMMLELSRVFGASRVFAAQRSRARLEMARQFLPGARFIATNPDPSGPSENGLVPACGAIAALIEKATGVSPYFVGKPNSLMMRTALRYLGEHSENTIMVGDRMETDVRVGIESGLETVLVMTGMTRREDVERFPYRPTRIIESVVELEQDLQAPGKASHLAHSRRRGGQRPKRL